MLDLRTIIREEDLLSLCESNGDINENNPCYFQEFLAKLKLKKMIEESMLQQIQILLEDSHNIPGFKSGLKLRVYALPHIEFFSEFKMHIKESILEDYYKKVFSTFPEKFQISFHESNILEVLYAPNQKGDEKDHFHWVETLCLDENHIKCTYFFNFVSVLLKEFVQKTITKYDERSSLYIFMYLDIPCKTTFVFDQFPKIKVMESKVLKFDFHLNDKVPFFCAEHFQSILYDKLLSIVNTD